jgi:hypothetical protein
MVCIMVCVFRITVSEDGSINLLNLETLLSTPVNTNTNSTMGATSGNLAGNMSMNFRQKSARGQYGSPAAPCSSSLHSVKYLESGEIVTAGSSPAGQLELWDCRVGSLKPQMRMQE